MRFNGLSGDPAEVGGTSYRPSSFLQNAAPDWGAFPSNDQSPTADRPFKDTGKMPLNLVDTWRPTRVENEQQTPGIIPSFFRGAAETLFSPAGPGASKVAGDIAYGVGDILDTPFDILANAPAIPLPNQFTFLGDMTAEERVEFDQRVKKAAPWELLSVTQRYAQERYDRLVRENRINDGVFTAIARPSANIGDQILSALSVLAIPGMGVERTVAQNMRRDQSIANYEGDDPFLRDLSARYNAGEFGTGDQARDKVLDELVVNGRGFTDNPWANIVFSIVTDPLMILSGGAGIAQRASARGFDALFRGGKFLNTFDEALRPAVLQQVKEEAARITGKTADEAFLDMAAQPQLWTQAGMAVARRYPQNFAQAESALTYMERWATRWEPALRPVFAAVRRINNLGMKPDDGPTVAALNGYLSDTVTEGVVRAYGFDNVVDVLDGVGSVSPALRTALSDGLGVYTGNQARQYGLSRVVRGIRDSLQIPGGGTITPDLWTSDYLSEIKGRDIASAVELRARRVKKQWIPTGRGSEQARLALEAARAEARARLAIMDPALLDPDLDKIVAAMNEDQLSFVHAAFYGWSVKHLKDAQRTSVGAYQATRADLTETARTANESKAAARKAADDAENAHRAALRDLEDKQKVAQRRAASATASDDEKAAANAAVADAEAVVARAATDAEEARAAADEAASAAREASSAVQIDPESITIIGENELTEQRAQAVLDAIAAGDEDAVKAAVNRYDLLYENLGDTGALTFGELTERIEDLIRPHMPGPDQTENALVREISPDQIATRLSPEVQAWANQVAPAGYTLGLKPAENLRWRPIWNADQTTLRGITPWLDATDEAGAVKEWTSVDAAKDMLFHRIRGDRIVLEARQDFVRSAATNYGISQADAMGLFSRFMKAAQDEGITPRGMSGERLYLLAMSHQFDDVIKNQMTPRDVAALFITAFEGKFWTVGATQKFTGTIKSATAGGHNYIGQLAEKVYPLVRFSLNPIFQAQELVEPFILNAMRGIRPGLKPNEMDMMTERLIKHLMQNGKYALDDQIEYGDLLLYGSLMAKDGFGPITPTMRLLHKIPMPDIKRIKHVNYLRAQRQIFGENMYNTFMRIAPDQWNTIATHYGTRNRGEIATRWVSEQSFLANANAEEIRAAVRAFKPEDFGARTIVDLDDAAKLLRQIGPEIYADIDDGAKLKALVSQEIISPTQVRDDLVSFGVNPVYADRVSRVASISYSVDEWFDAYRDAFAGGNQMRATLTRVIWEHIAESQGITLQEYLARRVGDYLPMTADAAVFANLSNADMAALKFMVDAPTRQWVSDAERIQFYSDMAANPPEYIAKFAPEQAKAEPMVDVVWGTGPDGKEIRIVMPGGKNRTANFTYWEQMLLKAQGVNPVTMLYADPVATIRNFYRPSWAAKNKDSSDLFNVVSAVLWANHTPQVELAQTEATWAKLRPVYREVPGATRAESGLASLQPTFDLANEMHTALRDTGYYDKFVATGKEASEIGLVFQMKQGFYRSARDETRVSESLLIKPDKRAELAKVLDDADAMVAERIANGESAYAAYKAVEQEIEPRVKPLLTKGTLTGKPYASRYGTGNWMLSVPGNLRSQSTNKQWGYNLIWLREVASNPTLQKWLVRQPWETASNHAFRLTAITPGMQSKVGLMAIDMLGPGALDKGIHDTVMGRVLAAEADRLGIFEQMLEGASKPFQTSMRESLANLKKPGADLNRVAFPSPSGKSVVLIPDAQVKFYNNPVGTLATMRQALDNVFPDPVERTFWDNDDVLTAIAKMNNGEITLFGGDYEVMERALTAKKMRDARSFGYVPPVRPMRLSQINISRERSVRQLASLKEPGWVYHGTSEEALVGMATEGYMRPNSFWSRKPTSSGHFGSYMVRARAEKMGRVTEGALEFHLNVKDRVSANDIEFLGEDGRFHPLTDVLPGETEKRRWRDPGPKPTSSLPANIDSLPVDEALALYEADRTRLTAWKNEWRYGIATGQVTLRQAEEAGVSLSDFGQNLGPLPKTLYHATIDLPGVLENGLKTRDELGGVTALGGGTSDTISFTADRSIAERIAEAFREANDVLNGRITPESLIDDATKGKWLDDWAKTATYQKNPEEAVALLKERLIERRKRESSVMDAKTANELAAENAVPVGAGWDSPRGRLYNEWTRPMTDEEYDTALFDAWRAFAAFRERNGGKMDPLFFAPDVQRLKAMDPSKIGVVEAIARPGAVGNQMSALGEWRAFTGDSVTVVGRKYSPEAGALIANMSNAEFQWFRWDTSGRGVWDPHSTMTAGVEAIPHLPNEALSEALEIELQMGLRGEKPLMGRMADPRAMVKFSTGPAGVKGANVFTNDGERILVATQYADVRTGLHELAHIMFEDLDPSAQNLVLSEYAKIKGGPAPTVLTREVEEWFADSFPEYIASSSAPTDALKPTFGYFRKWIGAVYTAIKKDETNRAVKTARAEAMREAADAVRAAKAASRTAEQALGRTQRKVNTAANNLRRRRNQTGLDVLEARAADAVTEVQRKTEAVKPLKSAKRAADANLKRAKAKHPPKVEVVQPTLAPEDEAAARATFAASVADRRAAQTSAIETANANAEIAAQEAITSPSKPAASIPFRDKTDAKGYPVFDFKGVAKKASEFEEAGLDASRLRRLAEESERYTDASLRRQAREQKVPFTPGVYGDELRETYEDVLDEIDRLGAAMSQRSPGEALAAKWRGREDASGRPIRNASAIEKELEKMEEQGYDVSEALDAISDWHGMDRSDAADAEDWASMREEQWDTILDALDSIEELSLEDLANDVDAPVVVLNGEVIEFYTDGNGLSSVTLAPVEGGWEFKSQRGMVKTFQTYDDAKNTVQTFTSITDEQWEAARPLDEMAFVPPTPTGAPTRVVTPSPEVLAAQEQVRATARALANASRDLAAARRTRNKATANVRAANRRTPTTEFEDALARAHEEHEAAVAAYRQAKRAENDAVRARARVEAQRPSNRWQSDMSPEMQKLFEDALRPVEPVRPPVRREIDAAHYDAEREQLYGAAEQQFLRSEDEAHTLHYYKRGRSWLERSANHPYFGLYPLSYMWGKMLPEMARFLLKEPFGVPAPGAGLMAFQHVYRGVMLQKEHDAKFRQQLADNEPLFRFISMMVPSLPWEIPVNAPLWARRVAEFEQNQTLREQYGEERKQMSPEQFGAIAGDVASYAFGPAYAAKSFFEAIGVARDTGAAFGAAITDTMSDVFAQNPQQPTEPWRPTFAP